MGILVSIWTAFELRQNCNNSNAVAAPDKQTNCYEKIDVRFPDAFTITMYMKLFTLYM